MYEIYERLRDSRGVKDATVAKATGIGKSTFTDWKKGRSAPKDEKLQKIADYFGVPVQYLRTGTPAPVFKIGINSIHATFELLKKNYPNLVIDENASKMMGMIEKFEKLSDDDKDEILNLIEFKIGKYKEKEDKNLA